MGGTELHTEDYSMVSGDLRNWEHDILPRLLDHGFDLMYDHFFDIRIPTLIIAECILAYLSTETANILLNWPTSSGGPQKSRIVIYDPIDTNDTFGKIMLNNLSVILYIKLISRPEELKCQD